MQNLFVLFFVAALASESLGMNLRIRRQSNTDGDDSDDQLEDRYFLERGRQQRPFPNGGRFPNGNTGIVPSWLQQQQQQQSSTTPAPNGSTTQSAAIQECIRSCPVTPEYNPVCGSNSVTYNNPGRLICAQACGVTVNLLRSSPCPAAATPAPN